MTTKEPGLDYRHGKGIFLFSTAPRTAFWDHIAFRGLFTRGIKRQRREADHSTPFSEEVPPLSQRCFFLRYVYCSTLKQTIRSSETSVNFYQNTRRHISEANVLN
jgi:hypothetical protein